jgi:hypothetical protein
VRLSEPAGELQAARARTIGKRVLSAYNRPADKPMMMAAKGPELSRKCAQTPIFGVMAAGAGVSVVTVCRGSPAAVSETSRSRAAF